MPKTDLDKIKVENLLEEFISELDQISSNGVVRYPDVGRISDLREHYINQCQGRYQIWLAEQIDTILSAKLHYFEKEARILITPATDKKMKEKIRAILQRLKENAPKYISWIVSWRSFNPADLARTFLQPVVSHTILSFSLVLNPPPIEKPMMITQKSDFKPIAHAIEAGQTAITSKYEDLEKIQPYSVLYDPVKTEEKKPLNFHIQQIKHTKEVQDKPIFSKKTILSEKISEKIKPAIVPIETPKNETQIRRTVQTEIRPISDIQSVFYLNEQRLKNCFYSSKTGIHEHKIPIRFEITPSGKTKNIRILDTKIDSTVAEKITLKIYQFRFNRVEDTAGDQLVYYTLFF